MTAETKPRRKKWKIAVGILLAVLILLAGGFFWYVSDYYRAEDVALEVLASGEHLEVRDDLTILSPSYPTDTAIIFYPGAKVEASAYLPLLNQLRQTGLTCILVEMPFHLAIFDVNAAEDVLGRHAGRGSVRRISGAVSVLFSFPPHRKTARCVQSRALHENRIPQQGL